ncbi:MAG: hypothetical protein AAGF97_05595, partial [Planctomycetota bacterium]
PPLLDGPTFLPPGESITLDFPQTLQEGQSLVVWFHAYQDRRGALSNYVGTNFTAFYATPIPEPGQTSILGILMGVGLWRRRLSIIAHDGTDRSQVISF